VPAQVQVCTPFAAFAVDKLEVEFGPRIDDVFELQSRFTLGADSDGIDLVHDPVTLALTGGTTTFVTTIPADSFKQKKRHFRFEGQLDGVSLEAKLTSLDHNTFTFKVKGEHANLTGFTNPVTLKLIIGNDCGETPVTIKFERGQEAKYSSQD